MGAVKELSDNSVSTIDSFTQAHLIQNLKKKKTLLELYIKNKALSWSRLSFVKPREWLDILGNDELSCAKLDLRIDT